MRVFAFRSPMNYICKSNQGFAWAVWGETEGSRGKRIEKLRGERRVLRGWLDTVHISHICTSFFLRFEKLRVCFGHRPCTMMTDKISDILTILKLMCLQRLIFDRPPDGVRKIVLATNMAETSITINDVVFVVDCGKAKETSYDALNNTPCLLPTWISKAAARQVRYSFPAFRISKMINSTTLSCVCLLQLIFIAYHHGFR